MFKILNSNEHTNFWIVQTGSYKNYTFKRYIFKPINVLYYLMILIFNIVSIKYFTDVEWYEYLIWYSIIELTSIVFLLNVLKGWFELKNHTTN